MANTPYFDSFLATVGNAMIILTPAQVVFWLASQTLECRTVEVQLAQKLAAVVCANSAPKSLVTEP